eukprot:9447571-Prorocentrum_lima.AAC.1
MASLRLSATSLVVTRVHFNPAAGLVNPGAKLCLCFFLYFQRHVQLLFSQLEVFLLTFSLPSPMG